MGSIHTVTRKKVMKCRTLSLCLYVGMLYCEGENPASAATRQTPTKAPDIPLAIYCPMYVYLPCPLRLQPSYDMRRCGAPKLTCEWFSYPHFRCRNSSGGRMPFIPKVETWGFYWEIWELLWCVAWVLKLSRGFGQASASVLTLVSAKHLVHNQKPSSNFLASAFQLYYIFMASLENCMHSFRQREYAILKQGK